MTECAPSPLRFQHEKQSWFFLKRNRMQTLIITIAKAVIYKALISGEKPKVSCFMNLLRIEAEKGQLARRLKNKPEIFEMKWQTLKHIVPE